MATEKFIIGKHDNGHHDGRAANLRREQAADFALQIGMEEILEEGVIFQSQNGKKRGGLLYQRWKGETESSQA